MKAARRLQAKECWVRLRWVLVTGTWYKRRFPHRPLVALISFSGRSPCCLSLIFWRGRAALDFRILALIAAVVECCKGRREPGPRHPQTEIVRVLATLRQFLREGTPWRSLRATKDKANGSTLRRWLECWAHTGVLAQVHALLVGMLRGHPDLI